MVRTPLKNTFGRDTNQFCAAQGATTQVCWMHSEEERRSDRVKLAASLRVADIFSSRCVAPRRSSYRYNFLVAPCGYEKISCNATRMYS